MTLGFFKEVNPGVGSVSWLEWLITRKTNVKSIEIKRNLLISGNFSSDSGITWVYNSSCKSLHLSAEQLQLPMHFVTSESQSSNSHSIFPFHPVNSFISDKPLCPGIHVPAEGRKLFVNQILWHSWNLEGREQYLANKLVISALCLKCL